MKYYLTIFIALIVSFGGYSQVDDTPSPELSEAIEEYRENSALPEVNPALVSQKNGYDTEPIDVLRFDRKKWKEVVGGIDYSEESSAKKPKPPEVDATDSQSPRIEQRVDRDQRSTSEDDEESYADETPTDSPILRIAVYALTIAIIVSILFLIIKNISLKSNPKIKKVSSPDPSTQIEDIRELEVDKLLNEAMTSADYRLAIRVYFLGLLKKLDEDGFIIWKKNKTNRDYLSELISKQHYFEEIKGLTLAYELVWYGDHDLPIQTYERIISSFKNIDQKLNQSKPGENQ